MDHSYSRSPLPRIIRFNDEFLDGKVAYRRDNGTVENCTRVNVLRKMYRESECLPSSYECELQEIVRIRSTAQSGTSGSSCAFHRQHSGGEVLRKHRRRRTSIFTFSMTPSGWLIFIRAFTLLCSETLVSQPYRNCMPAVLTLENGTIRSCSHH